MPMNLLPQLSDDLYLTDGGIETTLIFVEKLELPHFAAFHLLSDHDGTACLQRYFSGYARMARERGVGLVLESATWRASADWGAKLGYSKDAVRALNRKGIDMMHAIRREFAGSSQPIVVSGCIGPRGDGYNPASFMNADEATDFHSLQSEVFRASGVDVITAITMTYVEEAIGVVRAAQAANLPVVISFTTEIDGRLPSGQSLGDAIEQVERDTAKAPAYYMINCAHPTHFRAALTPGAPWLDRIRGIRANASVLSHAELDNASELDPGDPVDLGQQYCDLKRRLGNINVLGGCCGTDHRHVAAIFDAVQNETR